MAQQSRHIAIVGGGTAGWLAALILSGSAKRERVPLRLTMVESSKVPTIGVGEGSTAVFRQILKSFQLDEAEFIKETGATIKFGIRHKDWRQVGITYDGPIDDPHQVVKSPEGTMSSWINQYCVSANRPVQDPHLFTYLMDRNKSPVARTDDGRIINVGPFHYAYHFDQARVAKYLKSKAKDVAHVDGLVNSVSKDAETGNITSLHFEDAEDLAVDFVFDCTGFRRQIIGKEFSAIWKSYADSLPVNRAMPFWIDIKDDEEIAPYTLAWAQSAGWLWKIPTSDRYGCGYVYSDKHLSPDDAQREIEAKLGHAIEPRNDIKIDSGRLEKVWINNCIALGLSSSFLEPLEATSIHGTIVQLLLFARFHLKHNQANVDKHRDAYNQTVGQQVDDFMNFINLHYATERDDSPFWRDVSQNFITQTTKDRIAQWQNRLPMRSDFGNFPGGFPHIEEQLYFPVLDGLGHLHRATAKAEMAKDTALRAHARRTVESLTKEYKLAATRAMGHRAFLNSLTN